MTASTRRRRGSTAHRALPRVPRRGGRRRQDLRHARRGVAPLPARGRRRGRVRRDAQAALHRWSRSATCPSSRARRCEYRNSVWEEMDVDAVIARQPEVVLIDELAHTNVPGSGRHEKRWEDVLEILDAGIAVITTVNIQHIESLADAVERITGVGVRERVPDWVVRRADQLELIDSSADQLRRRMLHGNIYPEHKVPVRAERVLPRREPRRAPRAVAALRGRRDRGGAARVPPLQGRGRRALGDDRADHGGRDRRSGERRRSSGGRPASRPASRPTSSPCT